MGDEAATHIIRFQRPRAPGEPSSRDYDFSRDAVTRHQAEGYDLVKRTLENARRPRLATGAAK
jgi:NTE family protein